ncbi:MAG TPA: TerB family tellurite resistance protein [Stellaceae bacterium]|nr:TerB family tellurite resistance protein [Stellaceae bacterium]
MIDRLFVWLKEGGQDLSRGKDELQLAVAALLLEAAVVVDGRFDEAERNAILGIVERRFGLAAADAEALLAAAKERVESSAQLFRFTSTINERLARERRIEVIEMLWQVAYADGVLDPLEDSLLRRVAGLIDVSDRDRGDAKRRVLRGLGLDRAE